MTRFPPLVMLLAFAVLAAAMLPTQVAAQLGQELDSPLNNLFNLFFPVDCVVSVNRTSKGHGLDEDDDAGVVGTTPVGGGATFDDLFALDGVVDSRHRKRNHSTIDMVGRYASFSTILSRPYTTNVTIFPKEITGCDPIDDPEGQYAGRAVVVLRGECTFVEKVRTVLALRPLAVIVANNEPHGGLITMYSNSFNLDGMVRTPILFISHEDYKTLKLGEVEHQITLSTASLGNWFAVMFSMVLSPPLLVVVFYLTVILGQRLRRRQHNTRNMRVVKSMPVYVYNTNHLVDERYFSQYLQATGQEDTAKEAVEAVEMRHAISRKEGKSRSAAVLEATLLLGSPVLLLDYKINGTDVTVLKESLHLLTAGNDFFPAYKCSICLERYHPLVTRVLVLECKHFYHQHCLSNWLINFRRSCPLCNTVLRGQVTQYGSLDSTSDEELSLSVRLPPPLSPPPGPSRPFRDQRLGLLDPSVAWDGQGSLALEGPVLIEPIAPASTRPSVALQPSVGCLTTPLVDLEAGLPPADLFVTAPEGPPSPKFTAPPMIQVALESQVNTYRQDLHFDRPRAVSLRLEPSVNSQYRPRYAQPAHVLRWYQSPKKEPASPQSSRSSTGLLSVSIDED